MNPHATLRRRMRAQRLSGGGLGSAAEVVAHHLAVQAQEYAEAKWSLAQRIEGLPGDGEIEEAFARGEILRTHVLRPTWHFVTPADIGWLLELTAPRVRAKLAYQDRQLGLGENELERGGEAIRKALDGGEPLKRGELGAALERAGVEAKGQRLGHIVMHAELDGVVCSGPRQGRAHTYM